MIQEKDPQQVQEDKQLHTCPFCSLSVHMEDHISICPGISPDYLHPKPTFIRIDTHGCLCRNCWNLFTEDQWVFHRKSQQCRQVGRNDSRYTNSKRGRSLPERVAITSIVPSNNQFISQGNIQQHPQLEQINDEGTSGVAQDMTRIVQSIMTPLVKEWVNRHQHVRPNVLVVYLTSEVVNFGTNFLSKQIVVPTWEVIEKKGGKNANWKAFLEIPQNLFNEVFIDGKLAKMVSVRKQLKIVRGLNRLAVAFPGLVKRRDPPTVNRQHRDKSNISLKDVIFLIGKLFDCRKRRTVHLALDLYIILLCSQRYLADRESIKRGVLGLLETNADRQANDLVLTFPMQIGKTKVRQEIVLNTQLVLMLRQFGWNGWHSKTQRLVKRMRQWLGIYGYSFKGAIMQAVTEFGSNLSLAQRLAGHRSIRNTQIYTPGTKFRDILRIINSLVVPDLHSRFGQFDSFAVRRSLDELLVQHMRYQSFATDWLPALLRRLYGSNYQANQQNDEDINFMAGPPEVQPELQNHAQRQNIQDEIFQQRMDMQEQVLQESTPILCDLKLKDKDKNKIVVYGIDIDFTGGRFHRDDFFQSLTNKVPVNCFLCDRPINLQSIRYKCVFCEAPHHQRCTKTICRCSTNRISLQTPLLPSFAFTEIDQQPIPEVLMPGSFISVGKKVQEEKIKTLLSIRRFRYTRVAVITPGYQVSFPDNYWNGARQLDLPLYQEYIDGNYFPPVEAKTVPKYESSKVWGTQWGIFASGEIKVNVLIGQYACDVLQGKDLILCKKGDSIFCHSGGSTPDDTFLAPKDFSGFVPLINTAPQKDCNCIALRAIINGSLRIILVSCKPIKKGEQLFYDYGGAYKYKIVG